MDNSDYILRIAAASPVELVVITYDIMLDCINESIQNHKKDPELFAARINKARDALMTLVGALDTENAFAQDIYPLYMKCNTLLIGALVYEKKEGLEEAARILTTLKAGWTQVLAALPKDLRAQKNAPKVYSGLTYGKNGPHDYVEPSVGRGIEA